MAIRANDGNSAGSCERCGAGYGTEQYVWMAICTKRGAERN
jgi:hypothetical protein